MIVATLIPPNVKLYLSSRCEFAHFFTLAGIGGCATDVAPTMSERPVLEPTTDHPITVTPTGRHVVVRIGGDVVAETDAALTLQESTYPAVQYVPLSDVAPSALTASDTTTYCPYKGEANYYHVTSAGETVDDAIWTYVEPYPAVAEIAGHVAFYATKADVTVG